MIVDTPGQKSILLQIIGATNFKGEDLEVAFALKQSIKSAAVMSLQSQIALTKLQESETSEAPKKPVLGVIEGGKGKHEPKTESTQPEPEGTVPS